MCTFWVSRAPLIIPFRPLIDLVKQAVDGYKKQSPSHFALYIDVAIPEPSKTSEHSSSQPKLELVFQNFTQQVHKICRQYIFFQRGVSKLKVQVREKGRWISIQAMLNKYFPVSTACRQHCRPVADIL